MGASVRPDIVEQELARIRATAPVDVEAELANIRKKPPKGFTQRELDARRRAREATNADEAAGPDRGGAVQSAIETYVSGLPGGLGAVAAGRGVTGENPGTAMEQATGDVAAFSREHPRTALGLQLLGAAPAMLASAPLAALKYGGAAIGGVQAGAARLGSTENPGETLGQRLLGTAGAATVGAGVGAVLPTAAAFTPTRVAMGSGIGALLAGEGHRTEGAVAGGALAYKPGAVAGVVGDATSRFAPSVSRAARSVAEATGLRGEVNREMSGIQKLLSPLGGTVGAGETAAPTLLGARAAQEATSALNYGTAAQEGDAALRAYRAHRGNVVSENIRRAFNVIRRDAEDVAARLHGPIETAQRVPTLREAMDNFRERSAEVARRQTPRISESPFVRGTRAETVSQASARPAVDRMITAEGPRPRINTTADFPGAPPPLPGQLPVPPEVHPAAASLYDNPTIEKVAAGLRRLDEFSGMEPDDPRFLDSLYKVFSDQKSALAQRIEGATGVQPVNLGRFTERDVRTAQQQILDAVDEIMPTYREAVTEHAKASAWMDAYRRGYSMVRTRSTAAKNLTQKTPAAVEDWIGRQAHRPELQDAARQGARAGMADVIGTAPLQAGRAGLVDRSPFADTPIDAARRRVAMGTGADDFEKMLADVRAGTMNKRARVYLPGTKGHIASAAMNAVAPALERPAAQGLLGEILRDPQKYQNTLQLFNQGESLLGLIRNTTTAGAGNRVGRR